MERNHALYASQKYFTVAGDTECILVDGCQRETVFSTVIIKSLIFVVKDGESFVGDEQ